ncbi:ribose ABC transporter [Escherichia coli]|uniref:ribose ABC transporter n=1 Tax=Escherichia coli TaxID=562 RepID=UPI001CD63E0C|nr:ribose ABC transporter [Escherichia coli]MCQ6617403.1 ribose ABC transporter [Escherichia coli]
MKNIKLLGSAMLVSLALFSQSSLAKEYKIGASLLTQQHPFYIDLANAMKEEAKKRQCQFKCLYCQSGFKQTTF